MQGLEKSACQNLFDPAFVWLRPAARIFRVFRQISSCKMRILASTRFDKIHQKIQRRRVLRSFARANISQMQRENAKQYKILQAFSLPQVQIFAAQNRVSSALFGYSLFQNIRRNIIHAPLNKILCLVDPVTGPDVDLDAARMDALDKLPCGRENMNIQVKSLRCDLV